MSLEPGILTNLHEEKHVAVMIESGFMQMALEQARQAASMGEVPVGALVVDGNTGEVLAAAGNRTLEFDDPTAHAEMIAIRRAASLQGVSRLENCDLYVTLEPCAMCAGAISLARLRRLYFAAYDIKGGGVDHGARVFEQTTCNHKPEIYGGMAERAAADLLKTFFQQRR